MVGSSVKRSLVTLLAAVTVGALVTPVTAPAAAATTERYLRPADGSYELDGRGYGHGRGMSQWGAYGAATLGKGYQEILGAYYPGTDLVQLPGRKLRIAITVDDGTLVVVPAVDQRLTVRAAGDAQVLPAKIGNCTVTRWKVSDAAGGQAVKGYACGTWKTQPVGGRSVVTGPVEFVRSDSRVRIVLGQGSGQYLRDYRGTVSSVQDSAGRTYTVNTVSREAYLQSVVAAEMSASWPVEALKVQAVAARTYATWDTGSGRTGVYDTCDTVACQVYRGVADYSPSGALRGQYEWPNSDRAVEATNGRILEYGGRPAFTQFSASNGGRSIAHWSPSSYPYLPARNDPWDGAVPNSGHSWTSSLPVSAIERAFGQVGDLEALLVSGRDGHGEWGGRTTSVTVEGSRGSTTVTGDTFRFALGLKSTWWQPRAEAPAEPPAAPAAPASLATRSVADRVHVSWTAASSEAPITAYKVRVGKQTRSVAPGRAGTTFTGLVPGSYPVAVRAVTAYGVGAAATGTAVVAPYVTLAAPAGVVSGTPATLSVTGLAPGAPVTVQVRPAGWQRWKTVSTVTASAAGQAAPQVGVRVNTAVRVVSGGKVSTVRPVAAWLPSTLAVSSPRPGVLKAVAAVRPALSGVPVRVYAVRADGSKRALATRVTGRLGRIAVAVTGFRSGTAPRLVAKPLPELRTGRVSAPVTVRVR